MAYNTYARRTGEANMSFGKLIRQCLIRTLIAAIIGLVIYMSITFVVTGFNYKNIGYEILYSRDGENFEKVYEYRYTGKEGDDWVDENLEKYLEGEDSEYYYKQNIPSQLSKSTMSTIAWISQIASLIVWGALIYTLTWNVGNGAADKNELGGVELDKLRGLKAGLVAVIPHAVTYLILVIAKIIYSCGNYLPSKFDWAISIFKILNFNCFAYNDVMIPGEINTISVAGIICLAGVLLVLPLIATFGYAMGVRHTNIKEKIVYED